APPAAAPPGPGGHSAAPPSTPARAGTRAPAPAEEGSTGGVSVVPSGAPDTGAAPEPARSGAQAGLIGGGATAVLAAGGAAVFLVRRRATGA
ncbi:sortase-dependent protein, partial [Streptomyces prasinus]